MPNKEFLEKYPLYKKFKTDWCNENFTHLCMRLGTLPKPAIHIYCKNCKSGQTFNVMNEYYESDYFLSEINIELIRNLEFNEKIKIFKERKVGHNKIIKIDYLCSSCHQFKRNFLVRIFRKDDPKDVCLYMMKVGQYLPWSIHMDRNLENLLGEHSSYYKKGLTCESQSYGIGAYAYFRRITEEIIDELLNSITDLLENAEKIKYEEALEKVKKATVAQEKIKLVKDLLPSSLRPNGLNPLTILHSALSEGLHSNTDEKCLESAEDIKKTLIYLINEVMRHREKSKEFTKGMRKILDKQRQAK